MPGPELHPQSSGLLVLRHAQSTWNAAGRWQGWADPPLSEIGETQLPAAARALASAGVAPFAAVYSSDLQRARRTAGALAAALDSPPPVPRRDLREHDIGEWSGLTRPEIEQRWPGQIEAWSHGDLLATPGGEEREAFATRIVGAIEAIAGTHPGQRILVVCHGGAIRALTRALGSPLTQVTSLAGCWILPGPQGLAVGPPVDPLASFAEGTAPMADPAAE